MTYLSIIDRHVFAVGIELSIGVIVRFVYPVFDPDAIVIDFSPVIVYKSSMSPRPSSVILASLSA